MRPRSKVSGVPTQSHNDTPDRIVSALVYEYLAAHPDYQYPAEKHQHPSVLAMATDIKGWMIDKLGGPLPYWRLLLSAAKAWFPEKGETDLGKLFCQRLEIEAATHWDGWTEFDAVMQDYLEWRGLA